MREATHHRAGVFAGRFGQEDSELVAAVAADDVRLAQFVAQQFGALYQQGISELMSARVVDRFEVVEIDEHNRERSFVARRPQQSARLPKAGRSAGDTLLKR